MDIPTTGPPGTTPSAGGTIAGRYRMDVLVARGGMADVHRGHDEKLDRAVAIKVFRAGTTDPARFRNEIALLARLRHPHLVGLLDAGEHAGLPFIVLELCGETLAQRLAAGPMPAGQVREVGRTLASALAHVHEAGIVHRDVKPSNILFTDDGRAVLADFGVARLLDAGRITAPARTIGTAAYLAPELISGGDAGPPADVYALGLVLAEALAGRAAVEGVAPEALAAGAARPPELPATLPGEWRGLLASMTGTDPGRRPAAAAVASALAPAGHADATGTDPTVAMPPVDATAELPVPPRPRPVVPPPASRPARGWAPAAIVLAAAVLLGLGALAARRAPDTGDDRVAASGPASTAVRDPRPPAVPPAGGPGDPAPTCAQLEQQKRAIEDEKKQVEERHRDDKEARERAKDDLEDRKRAMDDQRKQLGC